MIDELYRSENFTADRPWLISGGCWCHNAIVAPLEATMSSSERRGENTDLFETFFFDYSSVVRP
jgi:hypothetical protein